MDGNPINCLPFFDKGYFVYALNYQKNGPIGLIGLCKLSGDVETKSKHVAYGAGYSCMNNLFCLITYRSTVQLKVLTKLQINVI